MKFFSDILKAALDFILPRTCLNCNSEILSGMLCNNCLDLIPTIKTPLCKICGRPIKKGKTCRFCRKGMHLDNGRAWTLFIPPVDKIIHHLKYRRFTSLASLCGRAMAGVVEADFFLKKSEIIVPVPLFWWKRLRRDYNQAMLLAHAVSEICDITLKDILRRTKNTKTQTKLDENLRRENVHNAFTLKNDDIRNKKVLLVDDVLTTGATIDECARVLKEAGAERVYSLVAAITPG